GLASASLEVWAGVLRFRLPMDDHFRCKILHSGNAPSTDRSPAPIARLGSGPELAQSNLASAKKETGKTPGLQCRRFSQALRIARRPRPHQPVKPLREIGWNGHDFS